MSLPVKHAAAIGASIGALCGMAISLPMDISISEAMLRTGVLTFAAAWGGAVLVWLDRGLSRAEEAHSGEQSRQ
ncbi:MAG TPA: hypothetical protein VJ961_09660 [Mariprofundaceae bacterium]|nr:hypothetical protein [Mariprofundaceae bacterium]